MARALTLRVITPDKIVIDERTTSVQVPGVDGSIGILPRHAHMVAALDIGLLHYHQGSEERTLFISDGFAEVRDDTVRVVCEAGERPEEIDEERAQAAEKRARERLAEGRQPQIDILRARLALMRAQKRLLARRGYGRTLV
jgi:F-type H+-transporting ATPase subunit epsilon